MNVEEEKRELVLARFQTLNPELKISLGEKEYRIKELLKHIQLNDEFGRKIVDTQIKMLKILTGVEH